MFDFDQWLKKPYELADDSVQIGNETFEYRRADGIVRETYGNLHLTNPNMSKRAFLLSNCLIDSKTKQPLDYQKAVNFVRRFDALSQTLEYQILGTTGTLLQEEARQWELAEKNSETTGSP